MNTWGYSKLSAIQFAIHIGYSNANKSENKVKDILKNTGMDQILSQEFYYILQLCAHSFGLYCAGD